MLPFSFNFDVGCDFFRNKRFLWALKTLTSEFFTCPQTSQLEKITCPEQQWTTRTTRTIDFATPVDFTYMNLSRNMLQFFLYSMGTYSFYESVTIVWALFS